MSELRLVPAAATVWAVTLVAIMFGIQPGALLVVAIALAALALRQPGHAMLTAGLGACALAVTWARIVAAQAYEIGHTVVGTISGTPREVTGGGWLVKLSVNGYPAAIPVFTETVPDGAAAGSLVEVSGQVGRAADPGWGRLSSTGTWPCSGHQRGSPPGRGTCGKSSRSLSRTL